VELLDGDALRATLSRGLGFSQADRDEHVRRIGFVAELLQRNGICCVVAAISPYRATRDEMRRLLGQFVEVHVRCSLQELERRDPKGLYARARAGEISDLTGLGAPYEEPLSPELVVDTELEYVEEATRRIVAKALELGYLAPTQASVEKRRVR
jgi:adenylyl-sulfate kinase